MSWKNSSTTSMQWIGTGIDARTVHSCRKSVSGTVSPLYASRPSIFVCTPAIGGQCAAQGNLHRCAGQVVLMARAKTCKSCGIKFVPVRPLQAVCCVPCAWQYAAQQAAKKDARLTREAKARLKTRAQWLAETQAVFNKFIRLRDAGQPCISCGRHHQGQWHAGHYRSTKAAPELRFEELNINLQCQPCNTHLSGNIVEYRKNLIGRIGIEKVEWLEGKHDPKHYDIEALKAIKAHYKELCKQLEAA